MWSDCMSVFGVFHACRDQTLFVLFYWRGGASARRFMSVTVAAVASYYCRDVTSGLDLNRHPQLGFEV